VQNLVGIGLAITDMHMCEKKTRFYVDLLLTSIYLSIPSSRLQVTFWCDFNAYWLKQRDFATINTFWWSH